MILSDTLLTKILDKRNHSTLVYGEDISLFNAYMVDSDSKNHLSIDYLYKNGIYMIDLQKSKVEYIHFLKDICNSSEHFQGNQVRKVIILLNIQNQKRVILQKIKTFIEEFFQNVVFILHTTKLSLIDSNINSRIIRFTLPKINKLDKTVDITYNRIIKLLKGGLTPKSIELLREICYMYYMNHDNSIELQQYIVTKIGSNLYLPNSIKYKVLQSIVDINKMYSYSYRKPIFLETIIYSLYNHLEHYTYNL